MDHISTNILYIIIGNVLYILKLQTNNGITIFIILKMYNYVEHTN